MNNRRLRRTDSIKDLSLMNINDKEVSSPETSEIEETQELIPRPRKRGRKSKKKPSQSILDVQNKDELWKKLREKGESYHLCAWDTVKELNKECRLISQKLPNQSIKAINGKIDKLLDILEEESPGEEERRKYFKIAKMMVWDLYMFQRYNKKNRKVKEVKKGRLEKRLKEL